MSEFAWLSRTELITGREGLEKLSKKHVLVVGLGGVGSFAAELICRGGIGEMTIIDGDVVDISNCNRQLPATQKNIGQSKAEWMEERLLSINPNLLYLFQDQTILNHKEVLDQEYLLVLLFFLVGQD